MIPRSDCAAFLTPGAIGLYTKAPVGSVHMISHALMSFSRAIVLRLGFGKMTRAQGR